MEHALERWGRIVARVPLLIVAAWLVLVIAALRLGPSLDSVAAKQNVQIYYVPPAVVAALAAAVGAMAPFYCAAFDTCIKYLDQRFQLPQWL